MKKCLKLALFGLTIVLIIGFLVPESMRIPVKGASASDWNHSTFWFEPWGSSGVHKGIDIFGRKGTPVVASTGGIVLYADTLAKGGKVVAILGPKWRIHYYAHLQSQTVNVGDLVKINQQIGTLGDTGNAAGKQPHVHYSILSVIPLPWLMTLESQGWKKMFFLNPHERLI